MTADLDFVGRTVVVTGAAGGLGLAYAQAFARNGAITVMADLPTPEERLGRAADAVGAAGGRAVPVVADLSTVAGVDDVVGRASATGRIDAVVNNAGAVLDRRFPDTTDDDLAGLLAANVWSAWRLTRAAWPWLLASGEGRVVTAVSSSALFGKAEQTAYAVTKGALVGLTTSLAVEAAGTGVRVNAVAPIARTRLTVGRLGVLDDRFGPEHVAPVVLWLAHPVCQAQGEIFSASGGTVSRVAVLRSCQEALGVAAGTGAAAAAARLPSYPPSWTAPRSARGEVEVWAAEAGVDLDAPAGAVAEKAAGCVRS